MSILKALRRTKPSGLSRRELFRNGGLLAAAGLAPAAVSSASAATAMSFGSDMYQSIGVRPVINAKGTFTVMSGSLMLPECRQAMQEASQNFVQLDELMAGVGKRIAEITGGDRSAPIALICARGVRSHHAANLLRQRGFKNIYDVNEGMLGNARGSGWLRQGLPTTACTDC